MGRKSHSKVQLHRNQHERKRRSAVKSAVVVAAASDVKKQHKEKKRRYLRSDGVLKKRLAMNMRRCHQRALQGNVPLVLTDDSTKPFRGRLFSNEVARALIDTLNPNHYSLEGFERVPEDGDWFAVVERDGMIDPTDATNILAYRVDRAWDPNDNTALVDVSKAFFHTQPKFVHKHNPATRSEAAALHLGCWQWGEKATWSQETRKQRKDVKGAMDKMLGEVDGRVGKKVVRLMKHLFPKMAAQREIIMDDAYQDPDLAAELSQRPALRQSGWLCMAVKEGHSDIAHIDMGDDWDQLTAISTSGWYMGGEIVLPQQKKIIPLRPSQTLFLRSRCVPHWAKAYQGIRFVYVGFMHGQHVQTFHPILKNQADPVDDMEEGELYG